MRNGLQDKSYFHVSDCVRAIDHFASLLNENFSGFKPINLGTNESIKVTESAKIICKTLDMKPKFIYTVVGKDGLEIIQ